MSSPAALHHEPVLLAEVLAALAPGRGGQRYLDGTFGGGGHTRALLEGGAGNHVVAFDCDPEAEARARSLQAFFPGRLEFLPLNFSDLGRVDTGELDGALFDLGLSSFHYDTPERGFSFRLDGPVDMRLDTRKGRTAAEFLERASREELVEAVRDFGEESRWRAVVDAVLAARGSGRLQRTLSLAELVRAAVNPPPWERGIHPATRSFQGIRIAVNDELRVIERGLPAAFERLRNGGVLAVISFHSLEDRIVKRFCNRMAGRPEHGEDSRPQQERVIRATLVSRRPISPSEHEVARNPRARSAKLRILRKGTEA